MACEGFWSSHCGSEAVSEARLEAQRGVTRVCGCQKAVSERHKNRGPSKVRWHARASEAVSAARKRSPRHGWRRSEGLQAFAGAKRQFRNVIKTEVRPACEDFWSSLCGSEAVSKARLEAQRGVTSVCGCQKAVSERHKNRGPSKVRWHARASEAVAAARKRSPRHGWRRSEGLQAFAGAKRQFRNVIKTEVRPRWDGMRGLLKQSLRLGSGLRGTAGGAARGYKRLRVPKGSFGTS